MLPVVMRFLPLKQQKTMIFVKCFLGHEDHDDVRNNLKGLRSFWHVVKSNRIVLPKEPNSNYISIYD